MRTFLIDANRFSDLNGFFAEAEIKLTDHGKIERNLTALNRVLSELAHAGPVTVIWKNAAKSRRELGHEPAVAYLEEVLLTCHPEYRKRLMLNIAQAKKGSGLSLYEMIAQVFTALPDLQFIEE